MFKILKENAFFRDNFILFLASSFHNFLGFVFHFILGRWLGPNEYGVLGVILSLIYMFTVLYYAVQTSTAQHIAELKAKNEYKKINFLFRRTLLKLFCIGLIIIFFFILFSKSIADYLNIDIIYLYIITPFIVLTLLLSLQRGMLQGLQWFKKLGANLIIEALVKVFVVLLLIVLGYKIGGALLAVIISILIPLIFGFFSLKNILKKKEEKIEENLFDSIPILFMLISLTAFYTIDILMIKHYFSSTETGFYIALSMIGKVLFFGSISVSQVMVPKIVDKHIKQEKTKNILLKSILIVFCFISILVFLYFTFSNVILNIFYGKQYLDIAYLLGWYGLFIGVYCLLYLLCFYLITIKKYFFIVIIIYICSFEGKMNIMVCYPPLHSYKGVPLLSQNRQFQWFNNPTYIFPIILRIF